MSEYQNNFCQSAPAAAAAPTAQHHDVDDVRPHYAMPPRKGNTSHKHRLFEAEINPGRVQRTEYMASFKKRADRLNVRSRVRTQRSGGGLSLGSVPLGAGAMLACAQSTVATESVTEERLQGEARQMAQEAAKQRWWSRTGKSLNANPIMRSQRFTGGATPWATPRSTYQRSFATTKF